jgi:hypothetical protein
MIKQTKGTDGIKGKTKEEPNDYILIEAKIKTFRIADVSKDFFG